MLKQTMILTGAFILGFSHAGCAAPSGGERVDRTLSAMSGVEQAIETGEQRLETFATVVEGIEQAEDLDATYRALDRNTGDLESTAQSIRSQRVAMQTRAAEHAVLWETESARLENSEARSVAEERRSEFEQTITHTGEELDALYAGYRELIDKAEALDTVLSNDLTRGGVDATADLRTEIAGMARDLREQSAETRQAVEEARVDFAG